MVLILFVSFSIQILLQIRILIQSTYNDEDELQHNSNLRMFGVDIVFPAIAISLFAAACHALIEILMLYTESKAAKMNIWDYLIICLAGLIKQIFYTNFLLLTTTSKII